MVIAVQMGFDSILEGLEVAMGRGRWRGRSRDRCDDAVRGGTSRGWTVDARRLRRDLGWWFGWTRHEGF